MQTEYAKVLKIYYLFKINIELNMYIPSLTLLILKYFVIKSFISVL